MANALDLLRRNSHNVDSVENNGVGDTFSDLSEHSVPDHSLSIKDKKHIFDECLTVVSISRNTSKHTTFCDGDSSPFGGIATIDYCYHPCYRTLRSRSRWCFRWFGKRRRINIDLRCVFLNFHGVIDRTNEKRNDVIRGRQLRFRTLLHMRCCTPTSSIAADNLKRSFALSNITEGVNAAGDSRVAPPIDQKKTTARLRAPFVTPESQLDPNRKKSHRRRFTRPSFDDWAATMRNHPGETYFGSSV